MKRWISGLLLVLLLVSLSACQKNGSENQATVLGKAFLEAVAAQKTEEANQLLSSVGNWVEEGKEPDMFFTPMGNVIAVDRLIAKKTQFEQITLEEQGEDYAIFSTNQTNMIWKDLWGLSPEEMPHRYKFTVMDDKISEILLYDNPEVNRILAERTSGTVGIRAEETEPGVVHVIGFLEESSAEEAGVQIGDQILAIDGMEVASMENAYEVAYRLNGEVGTEIILSIQRDTESFDVQLLRKQGEPKTP